MEPIQPEGDPQDLMEVANPTSEDIAVEYGKVPHVLKAGETRTFMRYLAEHICKYLTDRELNKSKKDQAKFNDPELRKFWHDKIILGTIQSFTRDKPLTDGERVALQNEMAAKRLEDLLAKAEKLETKLAKEVK